MARVVYGNVPYQGKLIIYVVKATQTSYINYMKPLILASELDIPHTISVVDTKEPWFQSVHPERMVPSLRDQDPQTLEDVYVFESTACLQYMADIYDKEGLWKGRTAAEKGTIHAWTAYQTAGLGATSKYWLYFFKGHPERLPKTVAKLHDNCIKQWDTLEAQLSLPEQTYIALKDRPTIADLSYLPFLMPWMLEFMGNDPNKWPHIKSWSQRMLDRDAVKDVLERAPKIGHD